MQCWPQSRVLASAQAQGRCLNCPSPASHPPTQSAFLGLRCERSVVGTLAQSPHCLARARPLRLARVPRDPDKGAELLSSQHRPPPCGFSPGWQVARIFGSGLAPGNGHPIPTKSPSLPRGQQVTWAAGPLPHLIPLASTEGHDVSGCEDTGWANATTYEVENISPQYSPMRY